MLKISEIKIPVTENVDFCALAAKKLGIDKSKVLSCKILRKSIVARKKGNICYVYTLLAEVKNEKSIKKIKNVSEYFCDEYKFPYSEIKSWERPVIIGAGPAGLFCALMLSRIGAKPILIERGQNVDDREKSIDAFCSKFICFSPHVSNIPFLGIKINFFLFGSISFLMCT